MRRSASAARSRRPESTLVRSTLFADFETQPSPKPAMPTARPMASGDHDPPRPVAGPQPGYTARRRRVAASPSSPAREKVIAIPVAQRPSPRHHGNGRRGRCTPSTAAPIARASRHDRWYGWPKPPRPAQDEPNSVELPVEGERPDAPGAAR